MMKVSFYLFVISILVAKLNPLFAQIEWKVPVTVTSNDWENVLYFGAHPKGTDAYDAGLDTLSPPPGFGPYAYFYISSFPNFLVSDIRESDQSTTWLLKTSNCSGKEVKLKWDLINFHSTVGQNGNLEISFYGSMLEKDSLILTGDVSLEILFTISPTIIAERVTDSYFESFISTVYPNPFNSQVNINFCPPRLCYAEMTVHNILGRKVMTLYQGYLEAKKHASTWDATDEIGNAVSSGIYFIRVKMDHKQYIKKVQLLR